MCKPLKSIIANLEAKYKTPLLYNLQERSGIIADFDHDIEEMLGWIERYEKNTKFVLERNLDVNIIWRSTLNLAYVMQHFCKSLFNYDYAIRMYLMDNRYEKNHDYWAAFIEVQRKLQSLFDRMLELNVFAAQRHSDTEIYARVFHGFTLSSGFNLDIHLDSRTYVFEYDVEKLNGTELIICIKHLLRCFNDNLYEFKNSGINWWVRELNDIYELNYLLFARIYWPKYEDGFRLHISKYRLRNNITINGLEKLRDELVHDFEYNTVPGRIWRDYSEDIPQMVLNMREQKLNEEQWLYFFKTLFEIEEYDRWIEELRNPPEAKKKAAILMMDRLFMTIMAKAVEQGLCVQNGWQYKWKEKVDAVYFASIASYKFNLSKRHDQDGDLTISWKPFESLFGEKGFRLVFQDYKNGKYKLPHKDIIDKLFK